MNIKPSTYNTFCLAKWLQVTIDLHHAVSKSCHHTKWTPINIEDAIKDPHHLHNTPIKAKEREEMLTGIKTKACSYCWDHESIKDDETSDRFTKSSSEWADYGKDNENLHQTRPTPSYIEVMFDKTCNLSCIYCSPDSSSMIEKEIREHGPYPQIVNEHRSQRLTPTPAKEELIESFFKWLPDLLPKLHTLRITGGEPLMSAHTMRLIKYLHQNKWPHLTFAINTNLMLSKEKVIAFAKSMTTLNQQIKNVQIYTSIEAYGSDAEYIRRGLNYQTFIENLESTLENAPKNTVTIIATMNKLSLPKLDLFLEEILVLKKQYSNLVIDFVPLQQPDFLSLKNTSKQGRETLKECYHFITQNQDVFTKTEALKFRYLLYLSEASQEEKSELDRNFKIFTDEYSRRYSLSSP